MNAREHIEAGEEHLAVADTKTTYSEAAAQHTARAHAHFAAATAYLLLDTQPLELADDDNAPGLPGGRPRFEGTVPRD